MTVGELYRVIDEDHDIIITQDDNKYFEGESKNIPMYLMDAHVDHIEAPISNSIARPCIQLVLRS